MTDKLLAFLEKYINWLAVIMTLLAIVIIVIPALVTCHDRNNRVMPEEAKKALFERIGTKIFIGSEGKRPFIICRQYRGKMQVWNHKERLWIKI